MLGRTQNAGCDQPSNLQVSDLALIPAMPSAGYHHSVLLKSDGSAIATGNNHYAQCNIPPLDEGMAYTQISAGGAHTVLLRSDGRVVAIGCNEDGQCDIPPFDEGVVYSQTSAVESHTVLLRSDGNAVAIGWNLFGQCDIPLAKPGIWYLGNLKHGIDLVLQLEFAHKEDVITLICSTLVGEECFRLTARGIDVAWETQKRIARELKASLQNLQLVLPDVQLLAKVCRANPGVSLFEVAQGAQCHQMKQSATTAWFPGLCVSKHVQAIS
jgi:hypothetical protein